MPAPRVFCLTLSMLLSLVWGAGVAQEYDRKLFRHWIDEDSDGMDTRQEVLASQSITFVVVDGDHKVIYGTWACPYTGITTHDPSDLDIDHIVPLEWAWNHGADKWDSEKRRKFANDPINTVAVIARVNRAKGSKGPYYWMPPNLAYGPSYIARFTLVVMEYGLKCPQDCFDSIKEPLLDVQNGIRIQEHLN